MEQIAFDNPPPGIDGSGGYGYGYGGDGGGYGDDGGDGYGGGYGDDGDGSGSGYGYGDDKNNMAYYAALSDIPQARAARENGAVVALWKSTVDGRPANGGNLDPVKVGDIHTTVGPLKLCKRGTLHATFRPDKWKGDRLWVVAMYGEIAVQDDKIGGLKREILAEITQ